MGKNAGMPLMRVLGNRLLALLATVYSGRRVTDAGSGLSVFKASLHLGYRSSGWPEFHPSNDNKSAI